MLYVSGRISILPIISPPASFSHIGSIVSLVFSLSILSIIIALKPIIFSSRLPTFLSASSLYSIFPLPLFPLPSPISSLLSMLSLLKSCFGPISFSVIDIFAILIFLLRYRDIKSLIRADRDIFFKINSTKQIDWEGDIIFSLITSFLMARMVLFWIYWRCRLWKRLRLSRFRPRRRNRT